jgi:uncharacterized protein YjiS (DUF1127 family)
MSATERLLWLLARRSDSRPLALLVTAARAFALALRRRREAAELASLDDRMLRDIGLTKYDVHFALEEPIWRDPTRTLADRAEARRRSRLMPPF